MIVSFDLDDTLFVNPEICDTEPALRFPLRFLYHERLRKGMVALLSEMNAQHISVWIYTTSYRSPAYIRSLFRAYGIRIDDVVNGERHQREVQRDKADAMPSKYPSRYRIALHVDDDVSVAQNGEIYGFHVCLIRQNEENWDTKVWREMIQIRQQIEGGKENGK